MMKTGRTEDMKFMEKKRKLSRADKKMNHRTFAVLQQLVLIMTAAILLTACGHNKENPSISHNSYSAQKASAAGSGEMKPQTGSKTVTDTGSADYVQASDQESSISLILPAVSIRKRVNTCSQKQVINISFWNMLLKIPGTKRNVSFPSLHFSALRMDLLLKPIMEERKSFPPPFLQDDMRSAISISPFLKVQRQSRWNTSLTAFPQAKCAFPMRVKKIQHTDLRQIQAARRDLSGWAILLPLIFRE